LLVASEQQKGNKNMEKLQDTPTIRQAFDSYIDPSGRKELLQASLRLLLRRLSHNIAVRRGDLSRLLPYAEPESTP
jgi:hypothetical protein